jgi:sugar/nucleoside kinase (ribokinase family)
MGAPVARKGVEVVSIGAMAVDYFGLMPALPKPGEKVVADRYEIHPGGVAGNVVTQVARLGGRAGWIGKIGDDPAGRVILEEFQREGIDYSHTEIVEGGYSMFTWIMVDAKGERTIVMFPNVLASFTGGDVESKHAEYITSAKILQTEACALALEPMIRAMEIARGAGVRCVFDLDVSPTHLIDEARLGTRRDLDRVLSLTDVLIPSKAAAAELLGDGDFEAGAERLLDRGPQAVVITLGEKGSIYVDRSVRCRTAGFRVEAVDTTGAGDAFHGGFIWSLLQGHSAEQACMVANACGAHCCTQVGARAMGSRQEIESLIAGGRRSES